MTKIKDEVTYRQLHLKKTQELMAEFIDLYWADRHFREFQRYIGLEIDKICRDIEVPQAKKKQKLVFLHITKGREYL